MTALTAIATLAACGEPADETPDTFDAPITAGPTEMPDGPVAADLEFLDPNNASQAELLTIPGMGAAAAGAVIDGRPYTDMVAFNNALPADLTDEQRDAVYTRIWLPLDLNTASGEEIQLIPGVGDQMQHEFEEYRPYCGIEEFRREIGKYVDDAEVARLERYVVVR